MLLEHFETKEEGGKDSQKGGGQVQTISHTIIIDLTFAPFSSLPTFPTGRVGFLEETLAGWWLAAGG